jgi:hypothetical protein
LLQIDRQSFFQGGVKYGIAGGVGEVRDHDNVFVGELWRLAEMEINQNGNHSDEYDDHGRRQDFKTQPASSRTAENLS